MKHQPEQVISIHGLKKRFGEVQALNGLDMQVSHGDIYGFLGPNGSGKSTTIRILMSLVKLDSGDVKIFGGNIQNFRSNILSRVGALIERPNFYEHLSAEANLSIMAKYSRIKVGVDEIYKTLNLVGLARREKDKVGNYSDGMKQRLGIAQALIHKPELLILDEPFNSLDPQGVMDVRNLVIKLNKEKNVTVVISSHKLDEIEKLTNKIVMISKGKTVAEGDLEELLSKGMSKISVVSDNPEKAFELLKISDISVESIEHADDRVSLRCYRDQIPNINSLLIANGIKVYELAADHSLESVFLSYTKGI